MLERKSQAIAVQRLHKRRASALQAQTIQETRTCYDGENALVPPEQIIKVDVLAPRPVRTPAGLVEYADLPLISVQIKDFSA